jgi:hypothetical protein
MAHADDRSFSVELVGAVSAVTSHFCIRCAPFDVLADEGCMTGPAARLLCQEDGRPRVDRPFLLHL